MPFFADHCAIGCVICGSVIDTRTIYGDLVVMIDVAAFMMIMGFFASVATGATASAFGVRPKPTRKSTLSRVTSSIFLPATVSPCCFMYAFMPPSICCPYCAKGPENSATRPSFTTPCACRVPAAPSITVAIKARLIQLGNCILILLFSTMIASNLILT